MNQKDDKEFAKMDSLTEKINASKNVLFFLADVRIKNRWNEHIFDSLALELISNYKQKDIKDMLKRDYSLYTIHYKYKNSMLGSPKAAGYKL